MPSRDPRPSDMPPATRAAAPACKAVAVGAGFR